MPNGSYLKTYQITLTALSPVHIGGGEKINKKEYIYDKQKDVIYYPKMRDLIGALKKRGLIESYERFLKGAQNDLFTFLVEKNNIDSAAWRGEPISVSDITDTKDKPFNEINTFIKDAYGMPYIPGSSIKGAFRAVILIEAARRARRNGKVFTLPDPKSKKPPREAKAVESTLLNVLGRKAGKKDDAVNDCLAAFRFSDSKPINRSALTICRKIDLPVSSKNSEPKKLPTFRECLKPQTKITLTVTVDTALLEKTPYADIFEQNGAKFLNLLASFNKEYQRAFRSYFNTANILPLGTANALYIGGGTGFLTKTMLLGITDDKTRLNYTAEYLNGRFYKHKHLSGKTSGVSPHILKITEYNGKMYEMGKCGAEIIDI